MSAKQLATSVLVALNNGSRTRCLHHATDTACPAHNREYAVEMVSSTLRFGQGVTKEVGQDLKNMNRQRTLVLTDTNVAQLHAFTAVCESLKRSECQFDVFTGVRCEPTDNSFEQAVETARKGNYDSVVAVGGGSTMDTAKVAALLAANRDMSLWDVTTPPFGKGQLPKQPMLPLICVPTTAGTGSEMTTVAIFDIPSKGIKTGVRLRLCCVRRCKQALQGHEAALGNCRPVEHSVHAAARGHLQRL